MNFYSEHGKQFHEIILTQSLFIVFFELLTASQSLHQWFECQRPTPPCTSTYCHVTMLVPY